MTVDLLTPEEVAATLRIPVTTVLDLLRQKRLPGFKAGRRWRVVATDLETWIREQVRAGTVEREEESLRAPSHPRSGPSERRREVLRRFKDAIHAAQTGKPRP